MKVDSTIPDVDGNYDDGALDMSRPEDPTEAYGSRFGGRWERFSFASDDVGPCPHPEKRAYRWRDDLLREWRSLREQGDTRNYYWCRCQAWHFTTRYWHVAADRALWQARNETDLVKIAADAGFTLPETVQHLADLSKQPVTAIWEILRGDRPAPGATLAALGAWSPAEDQVLLDNWHRKLSDTEWSRVLPGRSTGGRKRRRAFLRPPPPPTVSGVPPLPLPIWLPLGDEDGFPVWTRDLFLLPELPDRVLGEAFGRSGRAAKRARRSFALGQDGVGQRPFDLRPPGELIPGPRGLG